MSENKNNEAKAQAEEKENQELVKMTLDEAGVKAKEIIANANQEAKKAVEQGNQKAIETVEEARKEAEKIIDDANQVKVNAETTAKEVLETGISFAKELKNAKYVAINNIKEDGKNIKKGSAYNGKDSKNIKRLLEIGAIKVNK